MTQNETSVAAKNSTDLPTQAFQFGGFEEGSSRNGKATPHNGTYNYLKTDKKMKQYQDGEYLI